MKRKRAVPRVAIDLRLPLSIIDLAKRVAHLSGVPMENVLIVWLVTTIAQERGTRKVVI